MHAYATPRDVGNILGITQKEKSFTGLDLDMAVRSGLPAATVERVARLVSPHGMKIRYDLVAKATMSRRLKKAGQRLSPEESDRVVRLARLWRMSLDCWKTDIEARAFLERKHALLNGMTPLEVAMGSDVGCREVEQILGRLIFGVAA